MLSSSVLADTCSRGGGEGLVFRKGESADTCTMYFLVTQKRCDFAFADTCTNWCVSAIPVPVDVCARAHATCMCVRARKDRKSVV